MSRRRRCCALRSVVAFGALLALIGTPARAEARPLEIPPTAGWQHAETGLVLRARLADYERTSLEDNGTAELDVVANFAAPDQSTVVTLYLFRPALLSVPVWFDRSETQILLRDEYRGAQPVGEGRAFAPPSSAVASALRRTYVTGSESHKTTALAIMPMGDWLLAIRISSRDPGPAALDTRLDALIAAIGWPEGVKDGAPASLVADCPKPLKYSRRARLQRPSLTDALIGAALMGAIADQAEDETEAAPPPAVFCREGAGKLEYAVYRNVANLEQEFYLMALNDAGRTISVSPSFGALIDGKKGYSVSLGDLDRTLIYPNFDRLPSPDAVLEAVSETSPISSTARGSDGGSIITIDADGE